MSTFEKPASSADKFFTVVNELRPPFVIQLLVEGDGAPIRTRSTTPSRPAPR